MGTSLYSLLCSKIYGSPGESELEACALLKIVLCMKSGWAVVI